MRRLPTKQADVAGWAEVLRSERLNDTGRAAVDLIEIHVGMLLKAKGKGDDEAVAKHSQAISRMFGQALAADRQEHHRAIEALRIKAQQDDDTADRMGMH